MSILNNNLLRKGNGRHLIDWNRMYMSMYRKVNLNKTRFLVSSVSSTPAFTLIRSLLDRVIEPYFLGENEFEVYLNHIQPEAIMIEKIIDPIVKGFSNKNTFVRNRNVNEYLVPTSGNVSPIGITFNDTWNDWINVKPLRLHAHNSLEFSANFIDGMLDFNTSDEPAMVVFGLDVEALICKFIKHTKDEGKDLKTVDKDSFIREHVISHIYDDLLDVWIVNIISYLMNNKIDNNLIKEIVRKNEFVGYSSISSAIMELEGLIDKYISNKIPLADFMSTMFIGDETLLSRLADHDIVFNVKAETRYFVFDMLKSISLISIFISLLKKQESRKINTSIINNIKINLQIINRSRWQSHIKDKRLIQYISDIITDAESLNNS